MGWQSVQANKTGPGADRRQQPRNAPRQRSKSQHRPPRLASENGTPKERVTAIININNNKPTTSTTTNGNTPTILVKKHPGKNKGRDWHYHAPGGREERTDGGS